MILCHIIVFICQKFVIDFREDPRGDREDVLKWVRQRVVPCCFRGHAWRLVATVLVVDVIALHAVAQRQMTCHTCVQNVQRQALASGNGMTTVSNLPSKAYRR